MARSGLRQEHGLPHLGELCRRIRVGRGVAQSTVARLGGIAPSTVQRFEAGAQSSARTLSAYLTALSTGAAALPLTPSQRDLLVSLRADAFRTPEREAEYAAVHLDLLPAPATTDLAVLVDALRDRRQPGGIVDRLGFIHVLNWPALELVEIDPSDPRLSSWMAWHMLGVRPSLLGTSGPIAPSEALPLWVMVFLQLARPYLFTRQAGRLVGRLCHQSPTGFAPAWMAATSFLIDRDTDDIVRVTTYRDRSLVTHMKDADPAPIDVGGGGRAAFAVGIWAPASDETARVFELLARDPRSRDLYFARDFDSAGDFHVNSWLAAPDPPATGGPGAGSRAPA